MNINLRVVGIFANVSVTVDTTTYPDPTVLNLMQAASDASNLSQGSGVSYMPTDISFNQDSDYYPSSTDPNMKTISATYADPFTTPVEAIQYQPGTYSLTESFVPQSQREKDPLPADAYTVWQYYMFDENGKRIATDQPGNSFADQKLAAAGGNVASVIWRLVTIAENLADQQSKRHPASKPVA